MTFLASNSYWPTRACSCDNRLKHGCARNSSGRYFYYCPGCESRGPSHDTQLAAANAWEALIAQVAGGWPIRACSCSDDSEHDWVRDLDVWFYYCLKCKSRGPVYRSRQLAEDSWRCMREGVAKPEPDLSDVSNAWRRVSVQEIEKAQRHAQLVADTIKCTEPADQCLRCKCTRWARHGFSPVEPPKRSEALNNDETT